MAKIYCPSCGSPNVEQIDTDKYQCPYCGKTFTIPSIAPMQQQPQQQQPVFNNVQNLSSKVDDNPGCLMNGLCFILPLVGIIMYFVKKDSYPKCAKSYITSAIIGFVVGIILNVSGFWTEFWEGFWEGFYGN